MYRIAVLISGGGTDLQSIIDNIENGYITNCTIDMVISDKEDAYGLERAKKHNIKTYVVSKKKYKQNLTKKILKIVRGKVDFIVLAGFLSILDKEIIEEFPKRIINIHPSLIPAFCGKGMYGMKVHKKAIEYGVKYSGCTVHFVDEGTDTGPIIMQKIVPVYDNDSPETLQKRVLEEEHKALPEVLKLICEDKIKIEGRRVKIND